MSEALLSQGRGPPGGQRSKQLPGAPGNHSLPRHTHTPHTQLGFLSVHKATPLHTQTRPQRSRVDTSGINYPPDLESWRGQNLTASVSQISSTVRTLPVAASHGPPPLPSLPHLYSHPPPWAVNKSPPLLEHSRGSANIHRGSGSQSFHFLFTEVSFSGQHFKKADHPGMCLGVQQLGLSAFTVGGHRFDTWLGN